ncbi:MAG: alpha/beta fold hydrolase [Paracoccaceae bacterium]
MQDAPLYADVADGPEGGRAYWLKSPDGVRIRAAVWNATAPRGTVLLLPGRTEYVEKYGRAASDLAQRGYCTVSVDFRGQGLADRALPDRMTGHVQNFAEYQQDTDAVIGLIDQLALPGPRYLMCHSMGGCIGLRALMRGVKMQAAAFSAPMWGIAMAAWMRPVAQVMSTASTWFGVEGRYAPGTGPKTYVLEAPFAGNVLTTDEGMWDYMRAQAQAHPDLALGGPSLGWLHAALGECHALSLMPSPATPTFCALGLQERVVDTAPIHLRMAAWPGGTFDLVPGAEHEVMMEAPAIRTTFFDKADRLYQTNA